MGQKVAGSKGPLTVQEALAAASRASAAIEAISAGESPPRPPARSSALPRWRIRIRTSVTLFCAQLRTTASLPRGPYRAKTVRSCCLGPGSPSAATTTTRRSNRSHLRPCSSSSRSGRRPRPSGTRSPARAPRRVQRETSRPPRPAGARGSVRMSPSPRRRALPRVSRPESSRRPRRRMSAVVGMRTTTARDSPTLPTPRTRPPPHLARSGRRQRPRSVCDRRRQRRPAPPQPQLGPATVPRLPRPLGPPACGRAARGRRRRARARPGAAGLRGRGASQAPALHGRTPIATSLSGPPGSANATPGASQRRPSFQARAPCAAPVNASMICAARASPLVKTVTGLAFPPAALWSGREVAAERRQKALQKEGREQRRVERAIKAACSDEGGGAIANAPLVLASLRAYDRPWTTHMSRKRGAEQLGGGRAGGDAGGAGGAGAGAGGGGEDAPAARPVTSGESRAGWVGIHDAWCVMHGRRGLYGRGRLTWGDVCCWSCTTARTGSNDHMALRADTST